PPACGSRSPPPAPAASAPAPSPASSPRPPLAPSSSATASTRREPAPDGAQRSFGLILPVGVQVPVPLGWVRQTMSILGRSHLAAARSPLSSQYTAVSRSAQIWPPAG